MRNLANVTSIAVVITVIATMVAATRIASDLSQVDVGVSSGAGSAFVAGMNLLYTGTGFLLPAVAVASFFKGSTAHALPAPGPRIGKGGAPRIWLGP